MESPSIKKIYSFDNTHTYIREKGKNALATVLKQEKNINIIEKYIHKIAEKSEEEYVTAYKKIIYQTVGDIIKGDNIKLILDNIKNEMVGWKHTVFKDISHRIQEHDDFIINPFEVEEGVTECRKCGSKRVFTYSKQVRSSDEPMTTFAKCVKCKSNWTYSG
jgi:DNA-directed RNA polymerase subunit M/transcription elongation factor TFIIS